MNAILSRYEGTQFLDLNTEQDPDDIAPESGMISLL